MALERRKTLFDTNIPGSVPGAREAARRMSTRRGGQYEGRGGAIVNLSSAAARLGSPNLFVDYATSKGAIAVLTLGLSKELGTEGIRVNAVRPGILETDRTSVVEGTSGTVRVDIGSGRIINKKKQCHDS